MEKLSFYYSAMKGGKTTRIFQKIHDLEEIGQSVLLIKPMIDTKGADFIINRKGEKRKVDILLKSDEKLLVTERLDDLFSCNHIIVDEVQFLNAQQIEDIWRINKRMNIPVSCYGLRNNFRGELFEGSAKLMALADEIVELETNSMCACGCGERAKFNARKVDGVFTREGNEVEIDGANKKIEYAPLCGSCYYHKVYVKKRK
ncbi:MAG: thymidine kinase [bacterium]|jgi:thymidine kinase|nr:thymidine kinase [bacterium]